MKIWEVLHQWIVSENRYDPHANYPDQIDWLRCVPFILLNLSCLLVFFVGFSWIAFLTAVSLHFIRQFSIVAFYHRYFSHKAFSTNRFWQFVFACIAVSSVQRGPLWWSAHHRQHHLSSDEPEDAHSPLQHGFWWSHMGWIMSKKHHYYNPKRVGDWLRFPELVFLDRYDILIPLLLLLGLFIAGSLMQHLAPNLHTTGFQMLVWGFCVSTVTLFHTTVSINSFSHLFGTQRFPTKDNSRNNFLLALITLGEGWHNNHHYYPITARQGFMWWEIDITYYLLKLLEKIGVIWDVKGLPPSLLKKNHQKLL